MDYDASMYEVFNLGESQTVALSELIDLIERGLDVKAIIDRQPLQPGDVPATFADVSDLTAATGFTPATPIDVGIRRFVAWYRDYYGV
jgi:UDP-glucuronate 4-epimerase